MEIYLISTIISSFFTYIGTRKDGKYWNIWVVVALVIPCFIAGARDVTVGTDTATYGVPAFNYALQVSGLEQFLTFGNAEHLYLLMVYIITRFTSNIFWELFIIELVCIGFTYVALRDNQAGKYTWIGILVFHLMFYSFTLNLMRQFMCLAIELYAFKYVIQGRWKKYYLINTLAFLIQHTAIISFFIYPIYWLSVGNQYTRSRFFQAIRRYRTIFRLLIVSSAIFVVLMASKLIFIIAILSNKYQGQVENLTGFSVVWKNLIYMLPILEVFLLYDKQLKRKNPSFEFFTLSLIISIILWQLQGVSRESYRVSFYFGYFIIIMVPLLIKNVKQRQSRMILTSFFIILMFIYYVDYFVMNLYNDTFPYTSQLLGIS